MTWVHDLLARRRIERDLAEEIEQHLDEHVEALVAGGRSLEQARVEARRAFGSVTLIEERSRDVWGWQIVEHAWADMRYAIRQLRRAPSFTAAALLTLAVGIGANTAVFSVVNAMVLRPLPFPHADRLVSLELMDVRGGPHPDSLSYFTFFELRRSGIFERLACYREDATTLTGRSVPVQLDGQIVSWDLFQLLQVQPALGRAFLPSDEDRDARVVILSHEVWTSQFGADPAIVGRAVILDGEPNTVIGIAPAGFTYPMRDRPVQVWSTLARDRRSDTVTPVTEQRGARMLDVVGRLKPGVSLAETRLRSDAFAAGLAKDYPDSNRALPATYVRPELDRLLGNARQAVFVLLGAVALVLLMACANIASMLLARTVDREREFHVRLAIGGSRARVVRQLLTENLVLALLGGGVGVLLAVGLINLVVPLVIEHLPRAGEVSVDGRVLAVAVALALVTSVLVSIPPMLWIRTVGAGRALRAESRGSTDAHDRVRSVFVVAQVSVGLVLLTAACLLAAWFVHLTRRDLGFKPENLLTFSLTLPGARYPGDAQVDFMGGLVERLRGTPGVTAAAMVMPLPLVGNEMSVSFNIVDRPKPPHERPASNMAIVSPDYFATIGTAVIEGRGFTEQDDDRHPRVLVVNRAFAERFFPGERVIGRRIEPGATSSRDTRGGGSRQREIVGIVGNARQWALGREPEPIYYFPYKQLPWGPPRIIVRTAVPGTALARDMQRLVTSLDKDVPLHDVQTLTGILSTSVAAPRFLTLLMGSFAVMALLLTATGLYGVLAYAVLRRTREIGVRMALGATRGRIIAMVASRAAGLVAIGVPLGALGAYAARSLLASFVFAPDAGTSWALLFGATLVIVITAGGAAVVPALRAASIDPTQALRSE